MKVAVTRGYSIQEYLSRNFPLVAILPVESDKVALESVSSGESDAAISDLPTSSFFIRKYRIGNLRISGETGYVYRFAVGCRNDLPILNSIIIKVLDSVSSSEREALCRKWIPFDRNEFLLTRQFWILVVVAAGLVLGTFGGIRLWDFALMIRVKEKTRQIEEHRHRLETLVSERDDEIQQRIITEEALRESEERFRSYFELPFVGIAVVSSDGRFINVNPRFCSIVGYSQNELSTMHLADITAPEDLSLSIAEQCADDPGMKAVYERRYLRSDGSYVDIEVAHMRINERRGSGYYYIIIVRDLSERGKS
jgi:PAS domain S-box-containing protein